MLPTTEIKIFFIFLAIWLMPSHNSYGSWPSSGEIDLVESRGNRNMFINGAHIGTQVSSIING